MYVCNVNDSSNVLCHTWAVSICILCSQQLRGYVFICYLFYTFSNFHAAVHMSLIIFEVCYFHELHKLNGTVLALFALDTRDVPWCSKYILWMPANPCYSCWAYPEFQAGKKKDGLHSCNQSFWANNNRCCDTAEM